MSATSDTWVIPTPTDDATPLDEWIARGALQGRFLVADTTERGTLLTTLAAAGLDDTYVTVHRLDADAGEEVEYTVDGGTTWYTLGNLVADTDWNPLADYLTSWGSSVSSHSSYPVYARVNHGSLEMRGRVSISSAVAVGGSATLFTLAAGYRPYHTQWFPGTYNVPNRIFGIDIDGSGVCTLSNGAASAGTVNSMAFDSVVLRLDNPAA